MGLGPAGWADSRALTLQMTKKLVVVVYPLYKIPSA
jgi:hypothetical protein